MLRIVLAPVKLCDDSIPAFVLKFLLGGRIFESRVSYLLWSTRAGVYFKSALAQVAYAAVKATDNSYYRLKYYQISKRRSKERAIIAIARMIHTAVFQVMCTGKSWNPTDLLKTDMPEILKEKQLAKAVKQAIKFLGLQGMTVT